MGNVAKIRVLVVEDSLTIRRRLAEILENDPELELVGEAADGKRAIELCGELRPDVVTLDMMLPVLSGVAATEYIMAYYPTPILIVSASANRGEVFKTYDALAAGAVDVLEKPTGDEPDGEWERRFCAALKLVSRIKVITHLRGRLSAMGRGPGGLSLPGQPASVPAPPRAKKLVALGASTGGPAALVDVLRGMPVHPQVPVIIVLHIDEPFGAAFAGWLDTQTQHRVSYAGDGDSVASYAGRVALAPPGRHLIVHGQRFHLAMDAPRHSCRPSIDVLFESLARESGSATAACLLTGMGRDGASGLLEIRRAGGTTIAQDESTSVVYGMPREAMLLGAASQVLPLSLIGPALASALVPKEGPPR
ncbi:MAG TPA: chemotaxis-specific protein-glutamate methyltransferase CheB [Polyangiaceae bacterium]|jgi:two-component system chemotaxis response regulator CheB|nr:chemotaxis-specific protein-glutamate methyltransferase CheB [Polyangiaceae bacterium]